MNKECKAIYKCRNTLKSGKECSCVAKRVIHLPNGSFPLCGRCLKKHGF